MAKKAKTKAKKTKEAVAAGARLRLARDSAHMTLKTLASRSGIYTVPGLSNYEQGLRHLSIKIAKNLAPLLNSHAAYLMGLIDEVELRVLLAFHAGSAPPPDKGEPSSDTGPFAQIRRGAPHRGVSER